MVQNHENESTVVDNFLLTERQEIDIAELLIFRYNKKIYYAKNTYMPKSNKQRIAELENDLLNKDVDLHEHFKRITELEAAVDSARNALQPTLDRIADLEAEQQAVNAAVQPYRDRNAYLEAAQEVAANSLQPHIERIAAVESANQTYRDRIAVLEAAQHPAAETAVEPAHDGIETTTTTEAGTPPEHPEKLDTSWFGPRKLPDGYEKVVNKPGQRKAYLWSIAKKIGIPTAIIGGVIASASIIPSIPLIGSIPYLAQAVAFLKSQIILATPKVLLGTGVNAYFSPLAGLPESVGPFLAGSVLIPTTLLAAGLIKGLFLGRRYGGPSNTIVAAAMMPAQTPDVAYQVTMSARERAPTAAKAVLKTTVATPAKWIKKQVSETLYPAVQPNVPSVLGAAAGASLAVMQGTPVGAAALGGYFGVKIVRKLWQKLTGSNSAKK
jgi:hypothetical protein